MVSFFRFDVHGFTADCQQDEAGVQEAAQRCEFSRAFCLTAVCITAFSDFLLFSL